MSQPFIGEIRCFGFNFAPIGWAFCDGQLLSISDSQALFTIIGTTYGGNGQTNFALPNLQDRAPMDMGNGTGLTPRTLGQVVGTSAVTLMVTNLPSHTHVVNIGGAKTTQASVSVPSASTKLGNSQFAQAWNSVTTAAPNAPFASNAIGSTGGSQAHNNVQPLLTMNYCIALEGIYPSRN